jgi:hypothetical protein
MFLTAVVSNAADEPLLPIEPATYPASADANGKPPTCKELVSVLSMDVVLMTSEQKTNRPIFVYFAWLKA